MVEALVETWSIHNRMNLSMLRAIPQEYLADERSTRGRTVYAQFRHMHMVRSMWLKPAAPDLMADFPVLDEEAIPSTEEIAAALEASSATIEALIRRAHEAGGKVKGFKPHVTAFVGYLVSHQSHHRGQIEMTLKQNGHGLPDKVSYGLWEWGVR